jgi:GNAT superfamily N-acetyltransferase
LNLRSLAWRTDLIFPTFDGEIVDRGDYLVIRTPSNPTFYWGNFLLFAQPPGPADAEIWPRLFAEEIGSTPRVRHQTFGWDSPEGDPGAAEAFVAAGFRLVQSSVLTASDVTAPPRHVPDLIVRRLDSDDDWIQATENQIRCRDDEHDEAGYRVFKEAEMRRYRSMAQAGLGAWFGGFVGRTLVADLGIYRTGPWGRFQTVETHPDHRRQGFAGTLVYRASRQALGEMGIDTLVLVADADSAPERLYRSVGFLPAERQVGLERW